MSVLSGAEIARAIEQIRICRELDVDAALRFAPAGSQPPGGFGNDGNWHDTRTVVLASLHKARVAQPSLFTAAERRISRAWLREHAYSTDIGHRP